MGEKGNLVDVTEELLANLADQAPQYVTVYEQYKETRSRTTQPQAAAGYGGSAPEQATQRLRPPASG